MPWMTFLNLILLHIPTHIHTFYKNLPNQKSKNINQKKVYSFSQPKISCIPCCESEDLKLATFKENPSLRFSPTKDETNDSHRACQKIMENLLIGVKINLYFCFVTSTSVLKIV